MPSAPVFWDAFYAEHLSSGLGPVNRLLVTEADGLAPGTALDLGSGGGADAIWLAQRGWTVLGVDASATALARARDHAARLGLDGRALFAQHDLGVDFPTGRFGLVSAQFLHSPVAGPGDRERMLRHATRAVAPGGHLIVVSHWRTPSWHRGMPQFDHPVNLTLQSPQENRDSLQLAAGEWTTVRDELDTLQVTSPEGRPGTREDHVLHLRRIAP